MPLVHGAVEEVLRLGLSYFLSLVHDDFPAVLIIKILSEAMVWSVEMRVQISLSIWRESCLIYFCMFLRFWRVVR